MHLDPRFLLHRRAVLTAMVGGAAASVLGCRRKPTSTPTPEGVYIPDVKSGEDVFGYVQRLRGGFDDTLYKQVLGAANTFKEGDALVGVAAADENSRANARRLLGHTRLADVRRHPLHQDALYALSLEAEDSQAAALTADWTLGRLRKFLLESDEAAIHAIGPGLGSDAIGCVVKLMSDAELIALGSKVFNPLPGSKVGARGYMGARIQPNSPTDNVDDIRWQVFDGFSYAVGDVVLGCNPVSSTPESVAAIESALLEVLVTFGLTDVLPHCVLSHIDVQAEVERRQPGTTGVWFQSIAGSDSANATFDISVEKMLAYADERTGPFGLYFETGQGADFTNGHGHGYDMVLHESRKYGFARALSQRVSRARQGAAPWVHLNDVAGFIGPEVFRTREQLVRCCLEDIAMGKLHGLTIGLDICSTLHMDVSLDDLDWCIERIMPANPAYLMALPTKNDPMLGYLTTGFQDHVRIREQFGYKVDDRMWAFFQRLGVIDAEGKPTRHFGDPVWVYLQYLRAKGDSRPEADIRADAEQQLSAIRARGVPMARGYGTHPWDLEPALDAELRRVYADSKESLWTELTPAFITAVPEGVRLVSKSQDRTEYILHPETGEQLDAASLEAVRAMRARHAGRYDVQLMVSDGLNALAIMDEGQLAPYLETLRAALIAAGYQPAPEHLVLTSGRVRAGYRVGEALYAGLEDAARHRGLIHVIGERPGTGHHTFSAYITAPPGAVWSQPGKVDHNITRVVSGVALTAYAPSLAAPETVRLLQQLAPRGG
ncbi:ethanolamine ammonia-lyase subunit EutB [Myxococcus virescens]|uniref:Ethanolamine ammonia lyase large subunit n=1 Tax=Myxococcus virescens TaxID=83456 RepID=A0A511HGS7_9BACT|nr:ethanolamine ammonia-lyase subunit EutB [Myxococcus virescens]GEL72584.1 ethanolamine ammonia lyase large subunit [Myxococcus virescens]SDF10183.1 Ethanolamine ammonia-lyase light chain /Ethanolamine ammonia-lyase heavy chain [Myxococcus virescens]